MIKILAIGNSFSQDATALLQLLTNELFVRNLYIGGCSLERHCKNIDEDAAEYDFEENGGSLRPEKISIKEALESETWDYVTVQQVSGLSGKKESYYPYLKKLIEYVRRFTDAEILLHQTWAYEKGSEHPDFVLYDRDQATMWKQIKATTEEIAAKEKMRLIPVGQVVQNLRENPLFDLEKGGLSLNRDGFHLSFNYGRLAAAAVWCKFFTGKIPTCLHSENASPAIAAIRERIFRL